jgi:hypothetical protein
MKLFTFIIAALSLAFHSSLAVEETTIKTFKESLEAALKSKDLSALNNLFYTEGASQFQIDLLIHSYEVSIQTGILESVVVVPLEDAGHDSTSLQKIIDGEIMNGHFYVPNLKPLLFSKVKFTDSNGSKWTTVAPLGLSPDGELKFSLQRLKAEQDAAANP